jgi:DNA replication protein DnaC
MGELTSIHEISLQRPAVGSEPEPRVCTICGEKVPALLTITGQWVERFCECERALRRQEKEKAEHKLLMKYMAEHTFGGWLGKEWLNPESVKTLGTKKIETYDTERMDEYKTIRYAYTHETNGEKKERYRKTLERFEEGRKTWRNAKQKALDFAKNPQGSFLIYGEYGLGKSHLLAGICNELRHHGPSVSSLYVVAPRFFSVFNDRMKHTGNEWDLVRQMCTTPLAVFDDIDKIDPKTFREETLYQIIDERVSAGLPIAMSMNSMSTLATIVGKAAYSRLMVGCIPVEVVSEDYRLNLMQ